ncbi:DUF1850 domain-containing protein [Kushneria phosphatilytica]|uniref:DUF1850 domain-containing protein n=1 Tax=Kushneria phosphatilytica TaxID=657387 RepID=A0A1S1NV96_9GAMM|nr:DUF1850 domain-containing protein [Kushneria phosphatilytica]OHV07687.1 hypothetical protein BH688_15980 [Kushneria phosphatilytica]QEL10185.1 DUF1850 domain-containing protein [Kushneria phosphatilytica]
MKRQARFTVTVAVLVAVVLLACWPLPWLVMSSGGQWRFAFPAFGTVSFAVRWQHSVEREDWIEYYRLDQGTIRVSMTRFRTFGAGVPDHAGRHTRLIDGWVEMSGIDRVVDPLNIQAAPAEHYRLLYDNRVWPLYRGDRPRIVTFAGRRAPLWRVLPALIRPWLPSTPRGQGTLQE